MNKNKEATMASPDFDPGLLAKLIEYIWGIILALLGVIWKLNNKKIEKVENKLEAAVTKHEFNDHIERVEKIRVEMRESVRDLYSSQASISQSLARIEGKLGIGGGN